MSRKAAGRRGICPGCWRDRIAIIGNGVMARHMGNPGGIVCPASGQAWRSLSREENAERLGVDGTPGAETPIGARVAQTLMPKRWRR